MRVVVVDDVLLIRTGLATLLARAGFDVVASAADPAAALDAVRSHAPDVVLVDIRMPPTWTDEGLVLAQRIRRDFPAVGVLVLSQYVESSYALRLLTENPERAGYLLKERVSSATTLADALRRIDLGECVVDPEIVRGLFAASRSRGPLGSLTDRETEVLALMAEGHSNQAIAERLHLSPKTVETHIGRVFAKLGLGDDDGTNKRVLAVLLHLRHGGRDGRGP